MQVKIAAIDLGTNSARLLIGSPDENGVLQPFFLKKCITRLGGGFSKNKGISSEARDRTLTVLREFSREIENSGVVKLRAVATSAVRDAVNGADFVAEVRGETGIDLDVIDGTEEALLTLRGVIAGLDDCVHDFLLFDIGGGSTEYTFARGGSSLFTRSLPLGVVRLTEGKINCAAMEDKITRELQKLHDDLERTGLRRDIDHSILVGTAGTATTLAAIHLQMTAYDYRKVNNYLLSLEDIRNIYRRLLPLSPDERLMVPGLEKGREDLIIAGTLITVKTMEFFGFRRLKVSDFGLLEGLLVDQDAREVCH